MLRNLSIRNVVLIESLDLEFGPGLCVLTGETGAGKSILLDALGLALGVRADSSLVRRGAKQAVVSAAFDLAPNDPVHAMLEDQAIEAEDELVIRRVVGADGRSRAFANGQPVGVAWLREVGGRLIEIEGQFEHGGLLDTAGHQVLLDAFGGLADRRNAVAQAYDAWRAAVEARDEAQAALEQAQRDEEYLRHVVSELEALAPQPGDEEALADERALLLNGQKLADALAAASAEVTGEASVATRLRAAQRVIERAAPAAGDRLDGLIEALGRAAAEAADAEETLADIERRLDLDPRRLERVEERLFALRAAARKHQSDTESLPRLLATFRAQLADLDEGADRIERHAEAVESAWRDYLSAARALAKGRKAAATKLDKAVARELAPLKLGEARFKTDLEPLDEDHATRNGLERVRFTVTTTPGAEPGPLQKIASGGERARFLLALKVCLAQAGEVRTLIFDEVDRGIGGAVADAVGERLARLARELQVLVVTHSPQVAARAENHLRVLRRTEGKTAITGVDALSGDDRREEIARMLSGVRITDEARAAADSLIGGRAA